MSNMSDPTCVSLTPYEEHQLLDQLRRYLDGQTQSPAIPHEDKKKKQIELRRLYRKLVVRREQRKFGLKNFNLEEKIEKLKRGQDSSKIEPSANQSRCMGLRLLARYQVHTDNLVTY